MRRLMWLVPLLMLGCKPPKPLAPPTQDEAQRFAQEMVSSLAAKDATWIERHVFVMRYESNLGQVRLDSVNAAARTLFMESLATCTRSLQSVSVTAKCQDAEDPCIWVSSQLVCDGKPYQERIRVDWVNDIHRKLTPRLSEVTKEPVR